MPLRPGTVSLRAVGLWALTWRAAEFGVEAGVATAAQKPLDGGGSGGVEGSGSPFTEEFGKLVTSTLDKWHVPGVAIAVIDGHDVWTEVWYGEGQCARDRRFLLRICT